MTISRWALAATALGFVPVVAHAQDLESTLSSLTYREIGPALMGGRISDLAVVESKPQHFFVATGSGGLWKTENHGTSWTPLFDDQPTSSIGDVQIDQSNPNLVWVGTGEPANRQSSPWGNGVYKSTDGGETWAHMGLEATKHIGRVLIHPRDPDVVYVAAVGDLWGPNPERGVYRTMDGGENWELVLYVDEHTGAIDMAMDPSDPKTLFAAMYQRRRTGFGFNGGGPGSGLYRTVDGGESWVELTDGLPEGDKGRIGIDVYRGDGNLVFALVEADARSAGQGFGGGGGARDTGLYRSTDRGTTWEKVSDTNPRPMYYSRVNIDPTNPDRIYVLGTQLMISDDGGRTFRGDGAVQIHVDHHAIWINPLDPDHIILGSDGGVSATWDGTAHWRMFDNLALGQFYTISHDMRDPYYVCGGLQDNDPWCGPSNTRSFHGIRHQDWYETAYGDGFHTVVDPTDSTIVFSESQNGNMNRYDLITGEKTPMRPITGPRENGDTAKTYRFNWNSPLLISRHDPATIFLGGNFLMRSRDRGVSWEEVGGFDHTKQIDRDELEIMGAPGSEPMMSIHDGISTYGNLTVVGESNFSADVIYTGTDDGNVHVTRDGGDTWTDVSDNFPGLPERTYVSRLAPSAHAAGRVYASFDGHRNGDYAAYVYVSDNYGDDWDRIDEGLPHGWSVNVVTEHHRAENLLFVGNEVGVFVSIDRGESWTQLKNNFPTVPVDDLAIHPRENDLIVGTHGRSAWILDDIGPLEELASMDVLAQGGHVFQPKQTIMWAQKGDWPFYGATYSAPNPPRATRIRYYVGQELGEDAEVSLTVSNSSGDVVRSLDTEHDRGIHEVLWNWRHDPPFEARGGGGGGPFGGGGAFAPIVMPGTYTVALEIDGERWTSDVEIVAEPRRPMTMADRRARQDALMDVYRLASPLNDATQALSRVREQMGEVEDLLDDAEDAAEHLTEMLEAIQDELDEIGDGLGDARRWSGVGGAIQGSSTVPTEDQLWQIDAAWDAAPGLIERLNVVIERDVPELNTALNAEGMRPDPGEAVAVPRRGG
ncbi:MAG: hypothetical protein AAF389_04525 [Gemmatimonadota bacterium]